MKTPKSPHDHLPSGSACGSRRWAGLCFLALVALLWLPGDAHADVAEADSADFILDTTETVPGGGVAAAESGNFTLDTTATAPGPVDVGLCIFDGAAIVRIACEVSVAGGPLTSPLQFMKNGTTYGIFLTTPEAPVASKVRVQTSSGTKALVKLP